MTSWLSLPAYLPGVEVNSDHEGCSSRVRSFHCTSVGLTPTIIPNVDNSNAQFLIVGTAYALSPINRTCSLPKRGIIWMYSCQVGGTSNSMYQTWPIKLRQTISPSRVYAGKFNTVFFSYDCLEMLVERNTTRCHTMPHINMPLDNWIEFYFFHDSY